MIPSRILEISSFYKYALPIYVVESSLKYFLVMPQSGGLVAAWFTDILILEWLIWIYIWWVVSHHSAYIHDLAKNTPDAFNFRSFVEYQETYFTISSGVSGI